MSRCDKTDLPEEMCAHCRGLDTVVERDDEGDAFRAKYPGTCNICDQDIEAGDWIQRVGHKYCHHDCAKGTGI